MFRKIFTIILFSLVPFMTTGCAAGIAFGGVSPREIYRAMDDRTLISVMYNGTDADYATVSEAGAILATVHPGQDATLAFRAYHQNGDQRTLYMKGYKVVGKDTMYVGFRCKQVYLQGNGYGAGRSENWVVDRFIRAGENTGGCW